MTKAYNKSQRLNEIQRLLIQHQDGISKAELAELLGVDRTTIQRNIQELEENGVPIDEVEHGRFTLAPDFVIYNLQLNPAESLVLYLAARRIARQSSRSIRPMTNALEKLSAALRRPMMRSLQTTVEHTWELPSDPEKQAIFETLVQSWIRQYYVRIGYRGLHAIHTQTYDVAPYLFEPSPWGEGTYVIGYSERYNGLATFKLERIERAVLTTQPFTLPESIDNDVLLRHAWGIWTSESEPVRVVLRFSAYVARRVRESRWHPSETVSDLATGGLEWSADVAEPQEMLPWIRGWGADVEVLAPQALREELIAESHRLARLYGIEAKTTPSNDEFGLNDTFAKFFGGTDE
jgi:CRISPR-associated endonuclease/helicase Cas3